MEKTFISAIKAAKFPLLGCSITLTSLSTAKIIARAGFQWALIDMEHSPMSPELAMNIVHAVVAASGGTCFPLIRIPAHSNEWIKWALDSGASGIIIPMVDTAAQMRTILDCALYPPRGNRSWGPNNAVYASLDPTFTPAGYLELAREGGVAIIPMIESKMGLQNVEEILGVEGVSAAFIGPQDLRMSLGLASGRSGSEPEFEQAMSSIVEAAKESNLPVGSIGVGAQVASARGKLGMSFLLCGLDRAGFTAGITEQLKTVQEALST
jgi:4-hydroxy-2-oxoheptanedioate aldolase